MSEYQYYEFLAIDQPLTIEDREALRRISTRAEITSTRFTNEYEWGDLKADPIDFMKQWFDVHVYYANWLVRRLVVRLPRSLVDLDRLYSFTSEAEAIGIVTTDDHVILDLSVEIEEDPWDVEFEGGWMDRLAPFRADLLDGDYRLLYLLWLRDAWQGFFEEDSEEPMPGIGPLTDHLKDAAKFFGLNDGIIAVATERSGPPVLSPDRDTVRAVIAGLDNDEKIELLTRVANGDTGVSAELRRRARQTIKVDKTTQSPALRTVKELEARFEALAEK